MPEERLDGRVVLITGGARGIGLATATVLRDRGARVAIGDVDREAAEASAARLGDRVVALGVDVTDPASVAAFVDEATARLGPLDIMINNAGIMPIGSLLDESDATARRTVDVNLHGTLTGMKIALRHLLPRGRGHIVNVASVAGKAPTPGGVTYGATKAAIVSATESARVEFARSGVSFTCVMPSFTDTELISGTTGTKFVRTAKASEVGEAIAIALSRGRPDAYVPALLGPVLRVQSVVGRALRDRMNGMLGADRVFLEADKDARRAYTERIDVEE